jgi:diadenosine tetraphosphate (Ap4A) HIT family hydrolase
VAFAREAGCLACDLIADTARLPGGRLHESSRWVVEHTIGPLGLGTLVVKPFRHVVHVADLDETESAELGPLLQQTAAAVTQVVAPEQVLHLSVVARGRGAGAHPLRRPAHHPIRHDTVRCTGSGPASRDVPRRHPSARNRDRAHL